MTLITITSLLNCVYLSIESIFLNYKGNLLLALFASCDAPNLNWNPRVKILSETGSQVNRVLCPVDISNSPTLEKVLQER